MRQIVEPPQFGYPTNQLYETQGNKVLQRRAVVGKIPQDVIAYIDPLGDGKVIPMRGDEFGQAVRCHE